MLRRLTMTVLALLTMGSVAGGTGAAHAATYHPHWTDCTLHLDWATMTHVVAKECRHYPLVTVTDHPTGHWTEKIRRSPHVIEFVRYPTFGTPAPAVGVGCFGAAPSASYLTGIPAAILRGVIRVESGGNPSAVSPDGAIGCVQLMPGTAASLGVNPWNAYQNVVGGARYLASLVGQCGSLYAALACYNGGAGNPQYGYAALVMSRSG